MFDQTSNKNNEPALPFFCVLYKHFKYNVERGSSNTILDENVLTLKITGNERLSNHKLEPV